MAVQKIVEGVKKMKTKTVTHTPGPWTLGYSQMIEQGYWTQSIEGPQGYSVKPARANGDTQQQAEANARLIMAAPDLLEAAKQALRHGMGCPDFQDHNGYKALIIAIAKAEGKEVK